MGPWSLFLGAWIIIDGAGSILYYREQPLIEHLPRLLRILAGSLVILLL